MLSARRFQPATVIVEFIEEERKRCADLARLIRDEPDQLIKCIESGVWPDEFVTHESETVGVEPDDEFEDLM